MSDLTGFLLARIAEDEERINAWYMGGALWPHDGHDQGECNECDHRRGHRNADDQLVDRVLAECAAKRRIVEAAQRTQASLENRRAPATDAINGHVIAYRDVVRLLALPYADHPDYRKEWL